MSRASVIGTIGVLMVCGLVVAFIVFGGSSVGPSAAEASGGGIERVTNSRFHIPAASPMLIGLGGLAIVMITGRRVVK
ncbi:MAG: hypothetical protein AAF432_15045 [Planctomycetota bacterium]